MRRHPPSPPARFPSAAAAILALSLAAAWPTAAPMAATRLDETRGLLDSLARVQAQERGRLAELAAREESGIRRLDRLEELGAARGRLCRQLERELGLLARGERLQEEELAAGLLRLDSLGENRAGAAAEADRLRGETASLARRLFPLRRLDALGLWLQPASRDQSGRSLRRLPWLVRGLHRRLAGLALLQERLGELESGEQAEGERRRALLAQLERDQRRAGKARAEAGEELTRLRAEQTEQGRLVASLRRDRELAVQQAERLRRAGEEVARHLADLQRRWTEREQHRESESRRHSAVAGRLAGPGPPEAAGVDPSPAPAPPAPAPPAPAPTEGLAGRRGRLPPPVAGRVARPFGEHRDQQLGTVLDNPGVDYRCAPGSRVSAVHAGRVEKLTWVAGFGNTVLVSHGADCWTVYAKLEDVAVREGQSVAAGQLLGTAGRYDDPGEGALHFELWQARAPRDPALWLGP